MQNSPTSNELKLPVLLIAILLCSYVTLTEPRIGDAQGQSTNRLEFVGVGVPLDTSTGVDDGAVLAVHFMGDTHGNLDTCG
jgi:hypothetical protein